MHDLKFVDPCTNSMAGKIDGKELKFLVLINHVIFFWTGNVLAANGFWYARNHWKAPSLEFWTKLPFSPKRKSQNLINPSEMDSLHQKHKITCFYQGKILKNVPKRLKMSILTHCGGHFGFLHFSEGAPWFLNFFQLFLRKWDQEVSSHQFIWSSWWSETMP